MMKHAQNELTQNECDRPEIDKSQLQYGTVYHWITFASCLISLIAPVFILMFPHSNLLNPNLIFNAIFEGYSPAGIWEAAGVPFQAGGFWKLFFANLFTPDGFAAFGVVLGCSVTLWALIPAFWQFMKKKEYFYVCVSLFVMSLVALAMSGLINMAG
jgi:hypothetical protein